MSNIEGASGLLPGVFSQVVTATRGASVPGGVRIAALIGEGARSEVIITSALGRGKDGFNSTYTSTNGSDSRHFTLKLAPVVSNRTTLFRNGMPLVGLEEQIDSSTFDNRYDYRIDIATGRIELQKAHLVDQGGSFYSSGSLNIGQGTVDNLTLVDVNAPTETWTIKCISVQRNGSGVPIQDTAKFLAFGSTSGTLLDANSNPIVWIANGQIVSNTILRFSISETKFSGSSISPFREGDTFTIKVTSGVLKKNDSLSVTYIAVADINDPTFFDSMLDITSNHGMVSLDNTLSLGCQIAFDNEPPGIMTVQAAPSVPRRTSYSLEDNFNGNSTNCNDFIIPLPFGVVPDPNSQIHFFVTDPNTLVEKQVLPNKLAYYTFPSTSDSGVCTFVNDNTSAPAGHSFFYTVVKDSAVLNFGLDGYINRDLADSTKALFSSASVGAFDSSYVGKQIKIFDGYYTTNDGTFDISSVTNGLLNITSVHSGASVFTPFVNQGAGMGFELINPVTGLAVSSSFGTDGYITAITPTTTTDGYFSDNGSVNFNTMGSLLSLKLHVTAATSAQNLGLFDIVSYDSVNNILRVRKSFVSEHLLHFEVLDSGSTGQYLVLNHNIVPDGNNLRVTLVDSKDATFFDAGWVLALASLEPVDCDILVPLPKQTISLIFQNALAHCRTMSDIRNKKERVLFIGGIRGLTPDNITGAKLAAVENLGILEGIQGDDINEILAGNTEDLTNYSVPDAFGNTYRVVYFYPDEIVVQVGADNNKIDGFYQAAAAAGFLSGLSNIAIPLTNKTLTGFTILKNKMFSPTVLEQIAAAGVTVLQPVSGGGHIIWGKTTTQSGFPEEEEVSIVFIRDRISKTMRTGFAGFIGNPEDADIIPTLSARATALLNAFVGQGLITDFTDLVVKRDNVDPRQWDISIRVQPNYPVNWIFIKVSVGVL